MTWCHVKYTSQDGGQAGKLLNGRLPSRVASEVVLEATKEASEVVLIKEPPGEDPEALCSWWRRGRVELPVQKKLTQGRYRLSRLFVFP